MKSLEESRGEMILTEHLPARVLAAAATAPGPVGSPRLEDVEQGAILRAVQAHRFNRTETAKALGISRRSLIYKLQRLREAGFKVDPEE